MAAAAIKSYAEHQLKRIENRIAKLDLKKLEDRAKQAQLASACRKWVRMINHAS